MTLHAGLLVLTVNRANGVCFEYEIATFTEGG